MCKKNSFYLCAVQDDPHVARDTVIFSFPVIFSFSVNLCSFSGTYAEGFSMTRRLAQWQLDLPAPLSVADSVAVHPSLTCAES